MSSHVPRLLLVAAMVCLLVSAGVAPAYAYDTFQECVDQAINHNGEPPVCTEMDGNWTASWDDGPAGDFGATFAFLAILGVGLAIGITAWKVTTARRLATEAGMDPGTATTMTILSDDGLEATYLASSLRKQAAPSTAVPSSSSAAERLTELKTLLDAGLVTQSEFDERRKAIIDSV